VSTTRAVSCRALTSVAWIRFQANPCWTCGGKSKTVTDFATGSSGFFCRLHNINAPYSFNPSLFRSFIHHRRYIISAILFFILVVPCIVNLLYVSNQLDAVLSSLFIVLQNYSTCFACPLHPSSGVHKTVVTTTGTSHVYR